MNSLRVALVSGSDDSSALGLENFFLANDVAYRRWQNPDQVSAGAGLVILLRSNSERDNVALDQTAAEAVEKGWTLFNRSMPWIQDKEEEYRLYQSCRFDHCLRTDFISSGRPAPNFFRARRYVVKPAVGTGGRGVKRFDDFASAVAYGKSLEKALIQPYQEGQLLRVLAHPGGVLTCYEKVTRDSQWPAAISQGAKRQLREVPAAVSASLLALLNDLQADLVGFDVIISDDNFFLLEANAAPSLDDQVISFIDKEQLLATLTRPLLTGDK